MGPGRVSGLGLSGGGGFHSGLRQIPGKAQKKRGGGCAVFGRLCGIAEGPEGSGRGRRPNLGLLVLGASRPAAGAN